MRQTENGLWSRVFDCIDQTGREACRKSEISLFETLKDYMDEYSSSTSGTSNLALDNFRFIFLYDFLFGSLLFAAFCVYHLVKLVRKRLITRLSAPLRARLHRIRNWSQENDQIERPEQSFNWNPQISKGPFNLRPQIWVGHALFNGFRQRSWIKTLDKTSWFLVTWFSILFFN